MNPVNPETTLVILLGASSWPRTHLDGGPSFSNSANDLRDYFLDPKGFALPPANLKNLFDEPNSPTEVLEEVSDFLEQTVMKGRFHDLILYYVGHGFFPPNKNDLFLALKNSHTERFHTSLKVEDLAEVVRNHTRHMRRYVLLDCCYAGNASTIFQSSANQRAGRRTQDAFRQGTVVFCSSNKNEVSKAPKFTRHTMFSGSLLQVLQQGSPDFPAKLTMADVDFLVRKNIKKVFEEDYAVRPELHSPNQKDGDLREVLLFPNSGKRSSIKGRKISRKGQLMVASSIGGALYIDGEWMADLGPDDYFKTEPAPVGSYLVVFKNHGKPTMEQTVEISQNQTTEILLKPEPKKLPKEPRTPSEPKIKKFDPNDPEMKAIMAKQTGFFSAASEEGLSFLLKPGELKTFREGGIEVPMVWCPPGSFLMGSPEFEMGHEKSETQHQVKLTKGFWLAETQVTQKFWMETMGENPSQFKGENLPVELVSWENVQNFISILNKLVGSKVYRLPTEAEWEYSCKAGRNGPFNTGENLTTEQANFNGHYPYAGFPKGENRNTTTPIKTFPPNNWGLYDMHGNVWEWCQDWFGDYGGNQVNPTGPVSGQQRVIRGGSWADGGIVCRSSVRFSHFPGDSQGNIGFRLARSPTL